VIAKGGRDLLPVISLVILAFAVSLDGFGVGMMYGLRGIRIPLMSLSIICLCSGLVIFSSMGIGKVFLQWFHPETAKNIGAFILIGIGLWTLYQFFQQKGSEDLKAPLQHAISDAEETDEESALRREVMTFELKRFGLVIQILRTPVMADQDRSGTISASEATFLGIALSLDAFGAGIGAALIGFTPWLTSSVIAAASGIFLYAGLRVGLRFTGMTWIRKLSVLPGCVLVLIGIMKLL
jgi:putative sporulation protein YtaF